MSISRRASCSSCSIRLIWASLGFWGDCRSDNGSGCTCGDRANVISGDGDDGDRDGDGGNGMDGGSIYELSSGSGDALEGRITEGWNKKVDSVDSSPLGLWRRSCAFQRVSGVFSNTQESHTSEASIRYRSVLISSCSSFSRAAAALLNTSRAARTLRSDSANLWSRSVTALKKSKRQYTHRKHSSSINNIRSNGVPSGRDSTGVTLAEVLNFCLIIRKVWCMTLAYLTGVWVELCEQLILALNSIRFGSWCPIQVQHRLWQMLSRSGRWHAVGIVTGTGILSMFELWIR